MAKDNMTIVLGVLLGLLAIFGLYVFFSPTGAVVLDNYQYSNGDSVFDVQKVNEIESYITLLVGIDAVPYTINLRNDPLSLEDIPVEGNVNTRIFDDTQAWITINPEAELTGKTTVAALEIDKIIDNEYLYEIPVSSAMTQEYGEYPVKTCLDATSDETVIYLTLGSETLVYTDEYCIIVVGTDEDEIIRAADRLVLTLLGIMKA
tara:strand:- start:1767 stop:2381 length:615 start_codon:yes stop_codon:yes gene_type:complete